MIQWTKELLRKFDEAKQEAKQLDKVYLPKPEDQLVLTSDYSQKGVSATLWAKLGKEFLVVARMSARLDSPNLKLNPCDGEALAHYVAAKSTIFSTPIKASHKRTISLLDSKTVCQAANLLQQGRFSSSRIINNLLTSISDLNLDYQHLSGKLGQNLADDFGSRNPLDCDNKDTCQICTFIANTADLAIGNLVFKATPSMIVGNIQADKTKNNLISNILTGVSPVPFQNRNAMKFLQSKDPVLQRVRDLLTAGQAPPNKEDARVKKYFHIAKDGCLVCVKKNKKQLSNRELIVIPEQVSMGLIASMHYSLNHPSLYQMNKILDTRFFVLKKEEKIKAVWKNCFLCQAVIKIPKETETFEENKVPDHPGQSFTVDILKLNKKNILVAVENLSGFISTCFVESEKGNDLLNGIILTISPFKSSMSTVRVDQAPGFQKIFKREKDLENIGIKMEPGE